MSPCHKAVNEFGSFSVKEIRDFRVGPSLMARKIFGCYLPFYIREHKTGDHTWSSFNLLRVPMEGSEVSKLSFKFKYCNAVMHLISGGTTFR